MVLNQKIDKILYEINSSQKFIFKDQSDFNKEYKTEGSAYSEFIEYKKVIEEMHKLDLITIIPNSYGNRTIHLTSKGERIIKDGGWIKYIQNEKYKNLNIKYHYKTRYFPHAFAFLALVVSIRTCSINDKSNEVKILESKISHLEQQNIENKKLEDKIIQLEQENIKIKEILREPSTPQ